MSAMPILAIGFDPRWRARMQRLLGTRADLHWLGAYASAQPRLGNTEAPVLLLLDGDDPLIERERRRPLLPAPRRVYFYRHPDPATLGHCVAIGAHGCLDKLAPAEVVLRAVRAAESGLFVAAPTLLAHALRGHETLMPVPGLSGGWADLTDRQREIVRWAARGMSNKQIARQLGISPETVKTHLHHVFEREGVHSRTALLAVHQDQFPRTIDAVRSAPAA